MSIEQRYLEVVKKADILGKILNVYGDSENPLFLAKDIAEWIGHTNVSEMVRNLEEGTEKLNGKIFLSGQNREMTLLTTDGVYMVLANTRKPVAISLRSEWEYKFYSKNSKESVFGDVLMQAINEFDSNADILSKYSVDGYTIDFYVPKYNLAIEYDEKHHYKESNRKADAHRQTYIENKIGANFVRCDYRISDIKNAIKVIKEMM